ncbi:MAG: serine/threonine-protein kinase [Myxococcota bacterium]
MGSFSWRGSASDGEAAAAFLRDRVGLYVRSLFGFFLLFAILGLIKAAVFFASPELVQELGQSTGDVIRSALLTVTLTLGLGAECWMLRRAEGTRFLELYEWGGTFLGSLLVIQLVRFLPAQAPGSVVALPITLILVLRAGIVPSLPRSTAVLGVVVSLAMAGFVYATSRDSSDAFHRLDWVLTLAWGLCFAAATALVSHVIFGLREEVREARRLGNYTLAEKLGEGAMGVVYLAHHARLKRPTAIKVLPAEKVGSQNIGRFEREVHQLSRLYHPNTVAIFDYGRTPDGVFYYAMEYLDGLDLEELVERDGPQSPGRTIHILAQVAHALSEAHREGIIHRDIKPANVVLCHRGGVADLAKVVDFGLVKDLTGGSPALSHGDVVTGTPLFLAPESMTHPDEIDGRTDLYALGAVGYFLLTGEYVFDGATLVEVCSHHLHTLPEPPSHRRPDVPADLEAVILRCLEKSPDDRFETAALLREALLACEAASDWNDRRAERWWREQRDALSPLRSLPPATPVELEAQATAV